MSSDSSGSDEENFELKQRKGKNEEDKKIVKVIEFEETYRAETEVRTCKEKLKNWSSKKCTTRALKKSLSKNFPFINLFRTYKIKEYLPNDIVAGITVGIMMIPQGMAFGKLSTLTPVVGLYISLFAPLTYFFVGTSRQVSMGCIAVLSLMMASILEKYDADTGLDKISSDTLDPDTGCPTVTEMSDDIMAKRIEVAGAVSLATGIVTMVAGKLGLGFVINFMSNALITGFTVGVSIHVLTSQIRNIFGLGYLKNTDPPMVANQTASLVTYSPLSGVLNGSGNVTAETINCSSLDSGRKYDVLTRYSGYFKIVLTWIDILKNIIHTNPTTVIISLICMLIIYLVKAQINERFKKKMKIPIPIELVVVILGTAISQAANLQHRYNVPVVGKIHGGIPAPRIPDITLAQNYFFDALTIIVVAYAQTISMAKTLGMKNNYKVDSNQEMFATGSASVVCALFSGYITAASVSRSVVQDGAGGKTQVTSLVACCVVLLVIMVLGPYLHALPLCVLSSIIIVNLRSMFMKLLLIPELWRKSRYDCISTFPIVVIYLIQIVWVITFCTTVIMGTATGLMVGFLVSILMVVVRSQMSTSVVVGVVSSSDEFRSADNYKEMYEWSGIRVIRMDSPLYFANAEMFKKKVYKLTGVNPQKLRKKQQEVVIKEGESNADGAIKSNSHSQQQAGDNSVFLIPLKKESLSKPEHLILDMTGVTFVDTMGVDAIQQIINEFISVDICVFIADVKEGNLGILESTGFMKKNGERMYLTCDDAIQQAKELLRAKPTDSPQETC